MATSAEDFVRDAADAARPIFHHAVEELGLSPEQAELLVRRIVEAYLRGRADGADVLAHQINRALGAQSVDAAVVVRHAAVRMPGGD
jgi:hypothetical protein